jgi:hypothetical protein
MAIVANTYETFQSIGIREDLSDIINSIAPTDTPFWTAIKSGSCSNTFPEWQTDTLAAAAANAQLESDEMTYTAAVPTQRLKNQTQISRKTVIVSGTNQAVNAAGRDDELAYQISKMSKELKRDIEFELCGKNPVTAGVSNTTARKSGGLELWLTTNVSLATVGTAGVSVAKTAGQPDNAAALTDGTQRAFDEELLKGVVQAAWTQGGQPTILQVGAFNKRVVSGFTGNATRTIDAGGKRLQSAIDVYAHDFGELTVVPNRFSRDRTATVIDPEYWELCWLRPIFMTELAKTGDADKRALVGEWTLKSLQEAASGKVADLVTS